MKKSLDLWIKAIGFRAAWCLLALSFLAFPVKAQDVQVNCSQNPTCTLTPAGGISWANGNLTFIFRPTAPHVSIYIFFHNLNPTSAHTSQTISVFQSPFAQAKAPSLNANASNWTQDSVIQNSTAGASCNSVNALNDTTAGASGLGACFVNTMFAAQVAIKITGAAVQPGSPDNFELAVIQEVATPGGQSPGSVNSTVMLGSIGGGLFDPLSLSAGSGANEFQAVVEPSNTNGLLTPASPGQTSSFDSWHSLGGTRLPLLMAQAEMCATNLGFTAPAGATTIIAPTVVGRYHVCAIVFSASVTGTVEISEGTGAGCATGNLADTGVMTVAVGIPFTLAGPATIFETQVNGNALCMTTVGAALAGWIYYSTGF